VAGRLRVFLEESGFEVLGVKGMGIERFEDRPPVTQEELLTFGATTYEAMPKADTLLISCGALNTLRLLDPLEKRCKVPAKWGIATAATASFVSTRSASTGVRRLPIPNPLTAAIAPATRAASASSAR